MIGDNGSEEQALVDAIEGKGGEAVMPARKNRTVPREIYTDRSKDRNVAEGFWAKVRAVLVKV